MKVLLIAPYCDQNTDEKREDFFPSAALVYLASFLREKGHEPILLDLNSQTVNQQSDPAGYCQDIILETINDRRPKLVGFNCLFSALFPKIVGYANLIKSDFPEIKIAVGGIHTTSYYKEILLNVPEIDYCVLGEGENSVVGLSDCIERDDFTGLKNVGALAYRSNNGEIKLNERSYVKDLVELPMPAWDLIDFSNYEMDLSHYYNPKQHEIKYKAPIFTSRGCPYLCNFCDMFLVNGRKMRLKNVQQVVDEISYLYNNYGINYISFMDDNLTLYNKHILKILNEIQRRNLDIQFETTNGLCVNTLNEEVIAAMADVGLVSAGIAIEHGSDYIRNKIIRKQLKKEKIFEVVELLKKYKLMTAAFFIIGFPEETEETLQESYDLMNELKLDRMVANNLIAFPGTKLFEQVKRDGLFVKEIDFDNLWKTPITHAQSEFIIKPYKMSIEQLDEWRLKFDEIRYKYLGSGGYTQRSDSHIKGKKRLSYGSFPIRDGYLPSSRVGISQPT